jgi:class 3 adenylate cyclase
MAGALVAALRDHASIPPVRAGLAAGLVMLRDGDVFGPVVNLAARLAECAGGNEIVVSADLAAQLSTQSTPLGVHQFKGFADPIEVYRVEC